MTALALHDPGLTRRWAGAAAFAVCGHALALAGVLLWSRSPVPPVVEPVVLIELPEGADASVAAAAPSLATSASAVTPIENAPPVSVPPVTPPLAPAVRANDPLSPQLRPLPVMQAPVQAPQPALPQRAPSVAANNAASASANTSPAPAPNVSGAGSGNIGSGSGSSPKARKAQADYFAMVAAHLQRKKSYPTEAKKARQQGVVTVRFTVARDGSVSAIGIKKSSGHELLDTATLELLRRVAPLPRMPDSMERDSVTLSLPIDYSLRTD